MRGKYLSATPSCLLTSVELRVGSQEKRAEAEADLHSSVADLKLAQQNLERQRQIAQA